MKLYFKGHTYKYAAEQMLATLFPGEKPTYPSEQPLSGENALKLSLSAGHTWATAWAALSYGGGAYCGIARAPALPSEATAVERDRMAQRILKTAFYRAGTRALGGEPPWGALTGVRPVKIPTQAMERGATEGEAEALMGARYRVSPPRRRLAMDCAKACIQVKKTIEARDVALYIGIPFCPTRCSYCSFISSSMGQSRALMEPYLAALCREVAAAGAALKRAGKRVICLYIGGGTPTTLSPGQLERLMAQVAASFDLAACREYTVEAGRPDTITAEKLSVLRRNGADRVSVNPQTMRNHVLRAIGRAHTAEDTERAMALVRAAAFPWVNMDLIAGLPDDDVAGFRASLDEVLALNPENITVHTLTLKKGARLPGPGGTGQGPALPTSIEVSEMLDYAWQTLRAAGYSPYYLYRQKYMSGGFENVGWCRPGGESVYNICMMEEICGVLALGAGGATKLLGQEGQVERLVNPKYPKEYMDRLDTIIRTKENLQWPIN